MKSNLIPTIAFPLLTSGAALLVMIGVLGCHGNSRLHHPSGILGHYCQATPSTVHRNATVAVSGGSKPRAVQPTGILAELKSEVTHGGSKPELNSTGSESKSPALNGSVPTENTIRSRESRTTVSPVQSSRRSILTSSETDQVPSKVSDQHNPAAGSSTETATPDAKAPSSSEPLEKSSREPSLKETTSPGLSAQPQPSRQPLQPIASFELASSQRLLISVDSRGADLSESKRFPRVEEAIVPAIVKQVTSSDTETTNPIHSDIELEEPDQKVLSQVERGDSIEFFAPGRAQRAPTSLPRANTNTIRPSNNSEVESTYDENPSLPAALSTSDPQQPQPLELELRMKPWPDQPQVDPASRAYEIFQTTKSKAAYRDLSTESNPAAQLEVNQSATPGQLVSHRRAAPTAKPSNVETEFAEPRGPWNSITEPQKLHTGLVLQATPRSARVALSPLVTLAPGASRFPDPANLNPVAQPAEAQEIQPKYWPSIPDSHELLPIDEIGPIIDLPVSDSIRRFTVRPEESQAQPTIDR